MYLGSMEIVVGGSRRLCRFVAPMAGLALACWPARAATGDDLPSSGVVSVENAVAGLAGSPFGYTARTWQSDEGLPNNYVRAIVQTPDGYLWVGTSAGLARFDGLHFTAFTPQNTPPLENANITALCVDEQGTLWIGTYGGGLVWLKGGAFFHFGLTNGLAGDQLTALCAGRDGSIWIGTTSGLSQFKDDRFSNYTQKNGLLSDFVRSLCEDRAGSLWVASGKGLNRLQGGVMTSYTRTNGLPDNSVRGLWHQFGGYRCVHPSAVTGPGGTVGRVFQFCGGLRIWHRRCPDSGQGAGGPAHCDALCDPGRTSGRYRLGPADLVLGAAHQFVARIDGRVFGRRDCPRRTPERRAAHVRRHSLGRVDEDDRLHFRSAPVGYGPGLGVDDCRPLDVPPVQPAGDGRLLPQAAISVGRIFQLRARSQRCAENHGDHYQCPGHLRLPGDIQGSHVGDSLRARGHRVGHHERRVADPAPHGQAAHQAQTPRRILR